MASKRKFLMLEERVAVISLLVEGHSCRRVASDLGVGKNQIQNILNYMYIYMYVNRYLFMYMINEINNKGMEIINIKSKLCFKSFISLYSISIKTV